MIVDLDEVPTQQQLADLVGVGQSAVSGWYTEGRIPAGATLKEALRAYCAHLSEQAAQRAGTGSLDLAQERAALAREQRLGIEIRNADLRREYAPVEMLANVLAVASNAVAERIDHLPGLLKRACPDLSEPAHAQVLEVISQARAEWVRATAELARPQPAIADDFEPRDEDEPDGTGAE